MKLPKKLYGIWCEDKKDWLKEAESRHYPDDEAILTFISKQQACDRAAAEYGFDTYTEAREKGWCSVHLLSPAAAQAEGVTGKAVGE